MLDKLSALIEAMNEKYGADLTDADKVWVDQQWAVVKEDAEMEAVAVNNDRSQYEMVLEQKVKDLLLDRHEKNGVLFDMFFANPDFQAHAAQLPRRHLRRVSAEKRRMRVWGRPFQSRRVRRSLRRAGLGARLHWGLALIVWGEAHRPCQLPEIVVLNRWVLGVLPTEGLSSA